MNCNGVKVDNIYKEYICDSQEKAEFETKITMLVDELKKMQK